METITLKFCRKLNNEVETALKDIAEKYRLTVKVTGGRYNENSFTPKVRFNVLSENGVPADFINFAAKYNLKPEDYGKQIKLSSGKTVTITGINPRCPKYPITVTDVNSGKGYKVTIHEVKARLAV